MYDVPNVPEVMFDALRVKVGILDAENCPEVICEAGRLGIYEVPKVPEVMLLVDKVNVGIREMEN